MSRLLRPLITPTLEADGAILLRVDWLTIDAGNNVLKDESGRPVVAHHEECRIGPKRAGCGYVSEVGYLDAEAGLPAFFIDPAGLRHFVVKAERHDEVVMGGGVVMDKH
jgi:hypothetical protein